MWSKLKKDIDNLLVDDLGVEIRCVAYGNKNSLGTGTNGCGKYYVELDKNIIWAQHPYTTTDIGNIIRDYINTPLNQIMSKDFSEANSTWKDHQDFVDILIASDRRFGKGKLFAWYMSGYRDISVNNILAKRFGSLKELQNQNKL